MQERQTIGAIALDPLTENKSMRKSADCVWGLVPILELFGSEGFRPNDGPQATLRTSQSLLDYAWGRVGMAD